MTRFLIRPEGIAGERVTFDAEETRHLTRVLRLGAGRPGNKREHREKRSQVEPRVR